MSFLDSAISFGKSVFGGADIGGTLARTAILGFALNKMAKSVNKQNQDNSQVNKDVKTREQQIPDTNNSIPVLYGSAFVRGIITDAFQQDQKYMWYCLTLCEVTGLTNLGVGAASEFTFRDIYINKGKVTFQSDGITVASTVDDDGVVNTDINGLVKIYCFKNGSTNPVVPFGYTNAGLQSAYGVMPNWTSNHTMNDLVFALVRVEYVKEKSVTSLGEVEFKIENSMSNPGDCIYDYMTNTRYGAGIPPEEIYSV
jgi:hypothetical protein